MISVIIKTDGRTLKHATLADLRTLAVRRVVEDGAKPSAIAAEYGFCRTYLVHPESVYLECENRMGERMVVASAHDSEIAAEGVWGETSAGALTSK